MISRVSLATQRHSVGGVLAFLFLGALTVGQLCTSAGADGNCIDNTSQGGTIERVGEFDCVCELNILGIGLSTDTVPCQVYTIETPVYTKCEGTTDVNDCIPYGVVTVTKKSWECKCSCTGPSIRIAGVLFCLGGPDADCNGTGSEPFGEHPRGVVMPCPTEV